MVYMRPRGALRKSLKGMMQLSETALQLEVKIRSRPGGRVLGDCANAVLRLMLGSGYALRRYVSG